MAQLLIIDPQNDFMDVDGAALPVPGATADTIRLAGLIDRLGDRLTQVHLTLDTHREFDIGHPAFWVNQDQERPGPMTPITAKEIEDGLWMPAIPELRDYAIAYAKSLEAGGQYTIMVWPPHCLLGTWGHAIQSDLQAALDRWGGPVNLITKGLNPLTEHYGAVRAEVPILGDEDTFGNPDLIDALDVDDDFGIGGQAKSHCVKATVEQIADDLAATDLSRFTLLGDTMSPVVAPGIDFPALADAFVADMQLRGMKLRTAAEFLA